MKILKINIFNPNYLIFRNNYLPVLNKFYIRSNFTTDNRKNEEIERNESNKEIKHESVKKKKPNGLQIDCELKSPLKEFLNVNTASRIFVLKHAWKYIKDNNLQNPNMKRKIIPDEKLKQILDKDEVDILEIPKLLFRHMSSIPK
ncbi:SWIB/MDM2 domain-containing protein, putative [Plasmodium gallinaceum]|uniref:SWIB/MDM2 domain-containing protein, putative n=1 Tax=Plasmodium gallinaceum TaxID=5849 RepID=A0A1J1H077_PLAGA|nr:SWIB/MDM2 domain-containing protein, putative [Plasmodium gallinaceum]CRG97961.1 SWIB/MDM2 domain-containing protein, putative [Plasmodium gallinaceum]